MPIPSFLVHFQLPVNFLQNHTPVHPTLTQNLLVVSFQGLLSARGNVHVSYCHDL